ncbi:MAG: branched-chain amino acid transport system II carrier protein [Burkholderiaceae bacterium]|nr:branched-chain amino acid transport system II carrier protein [Burkholderiaceae bacterium]
MTSLNSKQRFLIGLTLFSMFFGAGNLIFPPFLGALAGESTFTAMGGFALTAVCFPVLAVIVVARTGGLDALASRVHPGFAFLFTLLIYLSIGPCLAIPRTASTSFEMALKPFFTGEGAMVGTFMGFPLEMVAQAIYSVLFFALAYTIALNPEKLTQRLGKVMSPTLIALIVILFVSCLIKPLGGYGAVLPPYDVNAFTRGFVEGYQTLDTIAALNFGLIIALNIQAMGVKSTKGVVSETIKAGLIAGVLLITIYIALAHVGATASGAGITTENGAQTLTAVADRQFGAIGLIILGAIFFLACLNVCVGLLSCCSNYFKNTFPVLSYRGWLTVFALCSVVVANAGLTMILTLSIPVLLAIYPVAIVLIVLGLVHPWIARFPMVYPISIILTALTGIVSALLQVGVPLPQFKAFIDTLPLASVGLEWIAPAALGALIGMLISAFGRNAKMAK